MALEGRYDFREAEPRLQQAWEALQLYAFDPHTTQPIFSVDTPPPTISGEIHVGHVFSYTQADIAVRFHRMRGEHVFYPFGFDDNGLPTERFTERVRGITAREVGREAFIRACLDLSAQMEDRFERFWKRLGLSVDWRLRYSTIDDRSRRVAQTAFIEAYRRGQAHRREAPTLWCPECGTAVAQADVVDKPDVATRFVTLVFPTTDGRSIRIATTRAELLPACVAVFVHADDPRFQSLVGATAVVPLFGQEVPILADAGAQPEKGTGAVMCCTFGDVTDVRWWHEHRLPLRIAITREGRMNDLAGPYTGLTIGDARSRMIDDLTAGGALVDSQAITHTVGVHERCGTAIEYLVVLQWFIELLAHKQEFLAAGRRIAWYPEHMRDRYDNWVAGLGWDWNISRQRYYGVPFPVWYCRGCGAILVAGLETLPLDPATTEPDRPCDRCGGRQFEAETDVMDTWATSSLTPRILASIAEDLGMDAVAFRARCLPMSLRPNAHDIIRTWDFYTIVRSFYQSGQIPWHSLVIAGHALDAGGQKLSKSKIERAGDPTPLVERYSADAVRYWTAGVHPGGDTVLNEESFRQGQRLVTKLWNAARFVLSHETALPASDLASRPVDRWLIARLGETVAAATAAFAAYDLAAARAALERFFWSTFCDTYLELIKFRLLRPVAPESREAAVHTARQALLAVLKLLAPFLPHVTDEIYRQGFATEEGMPSIHISIWPEAECYPRDDEATRFGEALLTIVDSVRRWKAERKLSVGAPLPGLTLQVPESLLQMFANSEEEVRSITRAERVEIAGGATVLVVVDEGV